MEKYSILMSVYKKDTAEHLRQSIESMLAQSVPCEQFVVVQDGPLGEDLCAVINEYAEAQPTVFTVVPLAENIGLGKALDVGLTYCRNDLVARMDADDISLPERCEKLIALFDAEPELGIAGTNIDEFYDDPTNVVSSRVVPSDYEGIRKFIRRRSPFNHPTVMFRRSAVERCGGYGKMRRKQDFDLFARMIGMGVYARNINESLLLFRADAGNYKRRKSWEYVSSYIVVQKENYKRGYCSLWDLIVGAGGQMVMFLTPLFIMKWLSDHLLRKKPAKPAVTEGDKKDEETLVSKHEAKGLTKTEDGTTETREVPVIDPNKMVSKRTKHFIKNALRLLPDKAYLKLRYRTMFGKKLDLKNPKTYNEKIQWMKLYDRDPRYNQLVDKYEVRPFVDERIGEGHLIPVLGVWARFEDIDFDALPDQFVLKCTHDSGSFYICRDKSKIDRAALKKHFDAALRDNQYWGGREWAYKDVRGRIIAEQFMIDDSGTGLKDYKFFCFGGEVKALMIATERGEGGDGVRMNFFDRDFNPLPFRRGHENAQVAPAKPDGYDEMIALAEKLAEGFRHVRVDLYNINGKIYFGEMTFYPACGFVPFTPEEWDYTFGSWLDLTDKKKP